jgi:predicted transcriptional regulator with HTH domain
VHFIRRHPALLAGGVAVLLALHRGDLRHVVQQGWRLLSLYPATVYLSEYLSCQKRDTRID